jgi:5-methylcytosine-specific restriction endonuclease McrA
MKFELKPYHRNTPSEELIADLKRVARELQKDTVSISEYGQRGKFHPDTMIHRFGSWNRTIEKAELRKGMVFNLSEDDLFRNIENVWVTLGRQPKAKEMKLPLSDCSITPYLNRFGTWQEALKKFVEYVKQDREDNGSNENDAERRPDKEPSPAPKLTSRDITHRLRFRILLRDGFTCRRCGASPLKSRGVELHVDHILPWSKGGETVPDNLETKCAECNLGKGNAFES